MSIRIVESVRRYFTKTLIVNFTPDYSFSGGTCYQKRIPSFNRPVDLYIVISPENDKSTSYFAAALPCYTSKRDGRPTVGAYILNYAFLKVSPIYEYLYFSTFAHEFTHILGFTNDLFDRFVDASNNLIPKSKVVTTLKIGAETFTALILPELVDFAKAYFNCPSITGVPLENNGGDGSAGSHWEKLFLPQEYMNPTTENPGILSEFTFKFLKSTGWYRYAPGGPQHFDWGKGAGCQHFEICPKGSQGYCQADQVGSAICSSEWTSKGSCNKDTMFSSGCPMKSSDEHTCLMDGNKANVLSDDTYGPGSRCINYNQGTYWKARCHKVECQGTTSLTITTKAKTVTCTENGQLVDVGQPEKLQCPDIADFCGELSKKCPNDCNARGVCMGDGTCSCYEGWSQTDCSSAYVVNYTKITSGSYYFASKLAVRIILVISTFIILL
jgi:leishmanolysin